MNVTNVTPKTTATIEGQSAAKVTEQTEVVKTPEQTESDKRFSEMAKKEKFLRFQQKKLVDEKAQIAAEKAALEALRRPQVDMSWKDKLKADPIAFLQAEGVGYDQITERLLNQDPNSQVIQSLKAEIEALKASQNETKESLKQGANQQIEQALKQLKSEAKMLVQGNEEFALIQEYNAQDQVVKLIKQTFDEEGYVMDVEEAAKEVETYLSEKALRIAQLKKVQEKLTPKETSQSPVVQPKPTTLTHSVTTQTKPASSKDRRERAIAAFQGKLSG